MFKKFFTFLVAASFIFAPVAQAITLWEYYEGNLPSLEERRVIAEDFGIENYTGTAAQNNLFVEKMLSQTNVFGAGYNPVTGYESRTTGYISPTASTIPVASTKDKSGQQIDLSNISSASVVKVYLNLEPGSTNEEPIVCTGVTSISWTGCTRGLAFQGSSEVASSTLQKAHNAGSKIIITNIGQFYNQYVAIDGNQTINDVKTFSSSTFFQVIPVIPTTTPTLPEQVGSKAYIDSIAISGSPNANTSTKGISKLSVDPVDPLNPIAVGDNDTRVPTQSENDAMVGTAGTPSSTNPFVTDDDTTSTPTADAVVRAQANSRIASGWIDNVILFGDGSDGDVVISGNTTLTRDMFYDDLTVNVGIILNPAGYRIFVKGTLTNNGSILRTGNSGSVGAAGTQGNSNAAGGAGGTKLAGVTVADGVAGGAGGAGGKGYYYSGSPESPTAGAVAVTSNSTASIGVNGTSGAAGGAGGNGDLTPTTGEGQAGGVTGTGGTATTPTTPLYYILGAIQQYQVTAGTITQYLSSSQSAGGSGGGGAGGDNPNGQEAGAGGGGGGAGGSGGVIAIYANTIVNSATGIIAALGGAGANGGLGGTTSHDSGRVLGGGGGGGGGAGGSGGVIVILTQSYTNLGTVSVAGGAGGTGAAGGTGKNGGTNGATGSNGQTGTTGIIYLFQL